MKKTRAPGTARADRPTGTPLRVSPWMVWAVCAGLLGSVLAVYWPVAGFEFINYDDPPYFTANPQVLGGLTWEGVRWAFTTLHAGYWQPLVWLSFMADVSVAGPGPAWPHVVNALLHGINTMLVFLLLRRLTGAMWRSAMVAALFALHPLRVESVAWVTERKDVLSTCFGLLALWLYCAGQKAKGKGQTYYVGALVCFALGLMSKPMLVTLPGVMLLLDYWPLGRMQNAEDRRQNWGKLILEKLPFFALAGGFAALTLWAQSASGSVAELSGVPMGARVGNALISCARYLGKTFWPVDLVLPYAYRAEWPVIPVAGAGLLVAGLCGVALWMARRRPYLLAGWVWFGLTLLPVSGLIQSGEQALADRFTYLPCLGLFVALVWGLKEVWERFQWPVLAGRLVMTAVLVMCAVKTRDQLAHWRNTETLFRHTLAVEPDNPSALDQVGYCLATKGDLAGAAELYQRALKANPHNALGWTHLGAALAGLGRASEAEAALQQALTLTPRNPDALNNLGLLRFNGGAVEEAMRLYRQALEAAPDHADARGNLGLALGHMGITLAQTGRTAEAVVAFQEAVQFRPADASAHNNLGGALTLQSHLEAAAAEFKQALALQPDYAEAHNNLGDTLNRLGRKAEAVAEFRQALRLRPDYPEARRQLSELEASPAP